MKKADLLIGFLSITSTFVTEAKKQQLNILLLTVDDMNYNSIGIYGSPVKGITPNIDKFATQGLRFEHAYVQCAVSMPSRNVLATGLYPQHSGVEEFNFIPEESPVKSIFEILQANGYYTGCMAKLPHCFPKRSGVEKIDMAVKAEQLNQGRSPKLFYKMTKEFLDAAKKSNKPFYLMCNSQDPHRPFYNSDDVRNARHGKGFFGPRGEPQPSHIFTEKDVNVPAFLPDIPDVRKEIAQYYNSVRRADDIVGEVLKALDESGMAENTVVFFLSDNGMSFPFSKTNVYLNSNRTPLMVRWPGVTKPNQVNNDALVSGIDYLPTVLDILSVKDPDKLDGKSFKNLLTGQKYESVPYVYTLFFANSAFQAFPMRCVQNKNFAYLFSPWAYDGTLEFKTETKQGLTYKAMKRAATSNDEIAKRLKLFDYRVTEEFYDLQKDPDALVNLAHDPRYTSELNKFRKVMEQKMRETNDDILEAFINRNDPQKLKEYVVKAQLKADKTRPYGIKGNND